MRQPSEGFPQKAYKLTTNPALCGGPPEVGGRAARYCVTRRSKAVEENAQRVNMHWVSDRWVGGTLTNFREIRKRVARLDQLEKQEAEGLLDQYSKKEGSTLRREMRKIQRNLGGIRKMERMPGALLIIDQRREINAVREANKVGIPVICLLDTDCDPDLVDIPIPGNDDGMRGIELVVTYLCDAIGEGLKGRTEKAAAGEEEAAGPRRRSRRTTTARAFEEKTADEGAESTAEPEAEPAAEPPAPVEGADAAQPQA